MTGQLPIQGARHFKWDIIIAKAVKFIPYLNYILDKQMVINTAMQRCIAVKEALNKKPVDPINNTINFLNTLSEEDFKDHGNKRHNHSDHLG